MNKIVFLFFITILLLVQIANSAVSNQTLYNTFSEIGKCDQIVSELAAELDTKNITRNTIQLCQKVSECYGSLNGETAKKLQKIYDFRCEKYEFYSYDMIDCYHKILEDNYYSSYASCSYRLDFTIADNERKFNNLMISKDCILSIANQSCTTAALSYLESNFSKFVNYIVTAPSENDSCESLHSEFVRKECAFIREDAVNEWWMFQDYASTYGKIPVSELLRNSRACQKAVRCHADPCNTLSTVKQMKNCEVYNATISSFYNCLKMYGTLHPVQIDNCSTTDMECIKKSLIEKCGDDTVINFDKHYQWFNKYDIGNLKNLKIQGNFSVYDIDDILRNSVSIDSDLGKCVPVVEQLVTLLSRTDKYKKHYRVSLEKCNDVTECYGSINSTESNKLKDSYKFVCDEIEIAFNNSRPLA